MIEGTRKNSDVIGLLKDQIYPEGIRPLAENEYDMAAGGFFTDILDYVRHAREFSIAADAAETANWTMSRLEREYANRLAQ